MEKEKFPKIVALISALICGISFPICLKRVNYQILQNANSFNDISDVLNEIVTPLFILVAGVWFFSMVIKKKK